MSLRFAFVSVLAGLAVTMVACAPNDNLAGTASSGQGGYGGSLTSSGQGQGGALEGSGGMAPSCTDGIKNGSETGVDCGGSCPACCTPKTYMNSSGFGSGTITACCNNGDALTMIMDCGVGMNHGAKQGDGNCGIGFEGAMNNGSPCVTVYCTAPCSGTSTSTGTSVGSTASSAVASSAAASSTVATSAAASSTSSGGGSCAHDKCSTGVALALGCDACVSKICATDDFCCDPANGQWDSFCVDDVTQICGLTCP